MESEKILNPFESDSKFKNYLSELSSLRKEGEDKINALKDEIRDVRANKTLEKEIKEKIVENDKNLIVEAKAVKEENKDKLKVLLKKLLLMRMKKDKNIILLKME